MRSCPHAVQTCLSTTAKGKVATVDVLATLPLESVPQATNGGWFACKMPCKDGEIYLTVLPRVWGIEVKVAV